MTRAKVVIRNKFDPDSVYSIGVSGDVDEVVAALSRRNGLVRFDTTEGVLLVGTGYLENCFTAIQLLEEDEDGDD